MNLVVIYRALSYDNLRLVPNQRDWEVEVMDFVHRGERACCGGHGWLSYNHAVCPSAAT